MSEEVLKVEHIGKKYKLLTNQDKVDTFAAVLFNSVKGVFSKKNRVSQGDEFWALKDISFTINKGEKIGIIGHNGAGKSTLLKVFSRITVPTEGQIKVKGRISSLLEVGTGFNQELTGRENIYLNGSILGMKKTEIESKFDEIVKFSEIGEFLDTPVKRYSSGMYVKLAFAVAANLDPDILIVDEVLAVGDMKFQEKCLGKMDEISGGGRTVLFVSHNMRTIQQLCDRVIVLDHGRIIYDGNVDDGIKIYMENNIVNSTFKNLGNQGRLGYVVSEARILSTEILNNKDCIFTSNDTLKFKMIWKSERNLKKLRLRFEVMYSDKTPVGASYSEVFIDAQKDNIYQTVIDYPLRNLAPGNYNVILLITQINQLGTFHDIDRVEHALDFKIKADKEEIEKIAWSHQYWGHVVLSDIKVVNTNKYNL